jgi:hypothetical protein
LLLWRNRVWLLLLLLLPLLPLLWGKRVSLLLLWGKHIWLLPLLKCRVLLTVFAFYLCSHRLLTTSPLTITFTLFLKL